MFKNSSIFNADFEGLSKRFPHYGEDSFKLELSDDDENENRQAKQKQNNKQKQHTRNDDHIQNANNVSKTETSSGDRKENINNSTETQRQDEDRAGCIFLETEYDKENNNPTVKKTKVIDEDQNRQDGHSNDDVNKQTEENGGPHFKKQRTD